MICIIIVAGHAAKLEEEILVRNQMTLLGAWSSSIMDALFMFDNFFIYNFLAFHYYCIMSLHVER